MCRCRNGFDEAAALFALAGRTVGGASVAGERKRALAGACVRDAARDGHVAAARLCGCPAESVELSPVGGAALIRGLEGLSPGRAAAVALAGPAVNLLLAVSFGCAAYCFPKTAAFCTEMLEINLGLMLFNPAARLSDGRRARSVRADEPQRRRFACAALRVGIGRCGGGGAHCTRVCRNGCNGKSQPDLAAQRRICHLCRRERTPGRAADRTRECWKRGRTSYAGGACCRCAHLPPRPA